jgi:hypothetical protein
MIARRRVVLPAASAFRCQLAQCTKSYPEGNCTSEKCRQRLKVSLTPKARLILPRSEPLVTWTLISPLAGPQALSLRDPCAKVASATERLA